MKHSFLVMIWLILMPTASIAGKQITFNHTTDPNGLVKTVSLQAGQNFTVIIDGTEKDKFDYVVSGVKVEESTDAAARAPVLNSKWTSPVQTHSKAYGGYWVNATKKAGAGTTMLTNKSWLILVETKGWQIDYAAGFIISDLVDPVYALEKGERSDGTEIQTIIQSTEAEDEVALRAAGLANVYYEGRGVDWLAFAFGLGIGDNNRTHYLAGVTIRMGGRANITFGSDWGQISRLPAGLAVGDEAEANALNDLPTRIDQGFFASYSYRFDGIKDIFEKPFKGQPDK